MGTIFSATSATLGLRALDDYDGLIPLRIELCDSLQRSARTQFLPGRQAIILAPVGDAQQSALKCTDARSARLIYHECVHAMTDAIARLRRYNAATLERRCDSNRSYKHMQWMKDWRITSHVVSWHGRA